MKKQVLVVTSPFRPNIGGVETHLDDLIATGTRRNIEFAVIAYQPLVTNARGKFIEKGNGYKIFRIPWPRFNLFLLLEKYPSLEFLYLFPGLFLGTFIYMTFNSSKVGAVHSQGLVAGTVGMIVGKIFSKKNIISTHSIYSFPKSGLYSSFVKYVFSNSFHILTLSNQSEKEVLRLGIDKTNVSSFTYWIDTKTFRVISKAKARKVIGIKNSNFIALFVGRLVKTKGVIEFLEAAKLRPEITFVVVGDGPLEAAVKKASALHKNILFKGSVENSDMFHFYNAADVLVIPSIHEEGFGRVILESLACGTPVIASKRGGIVEAMTKEVGIFINVSPKNISNALIDLSKDHVKLKSLSSAARKFAVKRFSEKNFESILKYYV